MGTADLHHCDRCGGVPRTHTTRRPAPGLTRRYRRCPTCGAPSIVEARRVVRDGEVVTVERLRMPRTTAAG